MNRLVRCLLVVAFVARGASSFAAADDEDRRVREAATVFTENMETPDQEIPSNILEHAEAIAIFPSLGLNFVHGTIDVTLPIAVDKTELRIIPARRKGAPDSLYRDQIRYTNQSHGAAGHVRSDDAEAFRRVQCGLQAEALEWIVEGRGEGRDRSIDQQTGYGDRTSEIGQRHIHHAWLEMLLTDH